MVRKPAWVYVIFDVEAGKSYYCLNHSSQAGFWGYEFTPSGSTGISNVKAAEDVNAPVYNLAGQQVSKDSKGVLIQNGRKFVNK